jgi:hypothetical protein
MKAISLQLLKTLTFKDVSVSGLLAISIALGLLAALLIPVTVR